MPKADIDLVRSVLQRNELDVRVINSVIKELEVEIKNEAELAAAEKEPPVKKQFVLLLADPEGKLEGLDLAGWVVQIPEDESPATAFDRVVLAATHFKSTKKGRRRGVATVAEAMEGVPAKIAKEHQLWIKTKEPVFAYRVPTELPDAGPEHKAGRGGDDLDAPEDEESDEGDVLPGSGHLPGSRRRG